MAIVTTYPRWLNEDEQRLWRLMLGASRKIDRVMDEVLQSKSALSVSEFSVLVRLSEVEGYSLRLRDLCRDLEWDRSRTSHQITRMERRGLVIKKPSECDARGVEVSLTGDGLQRLKAAAPDHVESVRRMVFDHMTSDQAAVLQAFFEEVLAVGEPEQPVGCD